MNRIKIFKSELYKTPLFFGENSVMCPICGIISNLYPCYGEGSGTAALHRLTYCGHRLENDIALAVLGIAREIEEESADE